MKISIIIPTLNEEKYLPKLLQDIKKQTFEDYEVVVADYNSKDATRKIARKFGDKVVKGGLPAVGRNKGAKAAKGELLLFLDADVRLPKDFLKKAYKEIQERCLDLATCEFRPLSNLLIDKVMHDFANIFIKLNQFSNPHAPGFCIFVTKRLFERVNGFNEKLQLAEDHDFVKRASKFGHLRVLESTQIRISVRRLIKEGRFVLIGKYIRSEMYRMFKTKLKKGVIKYEFGNFEKKDKRNLDKKLRNLEKKLIKMDQDYKRITKKYFSSEGIKENYKRNIRKMKKRLEKIKISFIDFFTIRED